MSDPAPAPHILVTGGTGYLGSHTCVALLAAGYRVTALDNLANSRADTVPRIARIAGRALAFRQLDVRDEAGLADCLRTDAVDAVIHFAGMKAVAESVAHPLNYYSTNVQGSLSMLRAMQAAGVRRFVFSSSATVYGEPRSVPIRESHARAPVSPYGRSKLAVEGILEDLHASDPSWSIGCLRYFNPAGAHPSGLIGDDPLGVPNNLMPYVGQVLSGRQPVLRIFGTNYDTPDGTAVRDYIHVMDLAEAHVSSLAALFRDPGCVMANVGTGVGHSVLEVVAAYEAASGLRVPRILAPRRAGDASVCCADPALAERWLGWHATRGLAQMCTDAWHAQGALSMPMNTSHAADWPAVIASSDGLTTPAGRPATFRSAATPRERRIPAGRRSALPTPN